jgi:hypothetical protein
MPKLKAVLDTLDGLPDGQKSLYVETDDGKFRLDAEGIEDVGGLKSALDKERRAKKELSDKLKKLGDIDIDEIEKLRADAEERAEKGDDIEKKLASAQKKFDREKAELDTKLLARDKKIHQLVAEDKARDAIEAAGGRPKVLLPHVLTNTKVIEEDGDFVAVVIDEKGNERTAKSGDKRFSLEDLVLELKADEEFASAFNGTGASGTGAPPSGSRGAPPRGRVATDTEGVEADKRRTGAYAI